MPGHMDDEKLVTLKTWEVEFLDKKLCSGSEFMRCDDGNQAHHQLKIFTFPFD